MQAKKKKDLLCKYFKVCIHRTYQHLNVFLPLIIVITIITGASTQKKRPQRRGCCMHLSTTKQLQP